MEKISVQNKYAFYQRAVQAVEGEVFNYESIYRAIFGKKPYRLREDFSGTFLFACEWIKSDAKRKASVVDLDPEPLKYGRTHNLKLLSLEQQKRLTILQADVRTVTKDKPQIIGAANFSFNIFKRQADLQAYFEAAHASLSKDGILLLDMVGGNGFIKAPTSEHRICTRINKYGKEEPWFTYYWNAHRYNKKTQEGLWSIAFKTLDGKRYDKVFTYDWHLWSLNEIRQTLRKAGFSDVVIFKDEDEEFVNITRTPKDYCWLCHVAGVK